MTKVCLQSISLLTSYNLGTLRTYFVQNFLVSPLTSTSTMEPIPIAPTISLSLKLTLSGEILLYVSNTTLLEVICFISHESIIHLHEYTQCCIAITYSSFSLVLFASCFPMLFIL